MHGLYRALAANMVKGVTQGFTRELRLVGVGYRAQVQGTKLQFTLGLSHPVEVEIPKGMTVKVDKQTDLSVWGLDKVRPTWQGRWDLLRHRPLTCQRRAPHLFR